MRMVSLNPYLIDKKTNCLDQLISNVWVIFVIVLLNFTMLNGVTLA